MRKLPCSMQILGSVTSVHTNYVSHPMSMWFDVICEVSSWGLPSEWRMKGTDSSMYLAIASLQGFFFLKNNFWTCIIWCDLFLHFYIGVQPIISILPQTPLLSMCNDFIECWKDITLYVCVIDLKGNDVAYIYLISPFSNWRYTKGEPSSSPGDVISILDYQSYHRGFIAGANYKRNIYCIQTNDYFLCRKTTCHILWLNVQWEKNFK